MCIPIKVTEASGHRKVRKGRHDILRLKGAYAPNTLRSYRADFEIFEARCAGAGKPP